jgi:uncharacterized protein
MNFVWALLLILALVAAWPLTLFGLPGNWLMLGAAALYAYLIPAGPLFSFGWRVVGGLAALAAAGEIVELAAGAAGTRKAGGSRRAAVCALVGSIAGGLLGMFVGLPVPVAGSIVAALLFAPLGALLGAIWGESTTGRHPGETLQVGMAAFWGRLFGTLAKLLIGLAMIVVVAVALLV